jgi:hypothetical protein
VNFPREWCRGPQFVSGSEGEWAPAIRRAQSAWEELEVASVTEGVRAAALVLLEPRELPEAMAACAAVGLVVSVLEHDGSRLRCAVHAPGAEAAWHRAWRDGDHDEVGARLGFPTCCRRFFAEHWIGAGRRDLVPFMREVDGPWESNTMLRWLGVRLVSHLPCSADCPETVALAREFLRAGRRVGVDVDSIEALLRLKATHDSVGEVAVVTTPYFRFQAGTDVAPDRARGRGDQSEPPWWRDNGFSDPEAAAEAHAVVAAQVGSVASAVDLGSGDGALLDLVSRSGNGEEYGPGPAARWIGVECDSGRAARGDVRRRPRVHVLNAKIQNWSTLRLVAEGRGAVILMPGRLSEMSAEEAGFVRSALRASSRRLVLYAYGDWNRPGGLERLAAGAGFRATSATTRGRSVEVCEAEVAA